MKKYRIESARLEGYDYTLPGEYFVTICTKGMMEWFGKIVDGEMRLSIKGKIVAEEWHKTPKIRSYVELDEWVVMPNHLHGIIKIIEISNVETSRRNSELPIVETSRRDVSTGKILKPKSLGSIINQYKSIVTKRIRNNGYTDFAWQARFYDHIIRDEKGLNAIREYINNNPINWEIEKNNPKPVKIWL